MLIKGTDLNASQRQQVLAAFVHRHTHENARQTYQGRCPACVQQAQCGGNMEAERDGVVIPWHEYHVPLKTDEEWLAVYAFEFVKDGSRLSSRRTSCVPTNLMDVLG
jgi:hypothetical protein